MPNTAPPIWRQWLESSFCVYAFIVFSGAFVTLPLVLNSTGGFTEQQHDPLSQVCNALILCGTLLFGYWNRTEFVLLLARGRWVNVFWIFAVASLLWSIDRAVTAWRLIMLTTSLMFAFYIVSRFRFEQILGMLAASTAVCAIASMLTAIIFPAIGKSTPADPDAWSGVFSHKNQLGWEMLAMAIVFIWFAIHDPRRRILAIAMFGFCLIVAEKSQSATCLVTVGLVLVATAFLRVLRLPMLPRAWLLLSGGVITIASGSVILANLPAVSQAIGKDPTMTGRTFLWASLIRMLPNRLILGRGYHAFWTDKNPEAWIIWGRNGWLMHEAHNAYIDAVLSTGLVGLTIACLTLIVPMIWGVRRCLTDEPIWADFVFLYCFALTVTNFSETLLYQAGDLHCVLLPICYLATRAYDLPSRVAAMPPRAMSLKARFLAGGRVATLTARLAKNDDHGSTATHLTNSSQ
jgi:exopolysaccharide production protein ExoQ